MAGRTWAPSWRDCARSGPGLQRRGRTPRYAPVQASSINLLQVSLSLPRSYLHAGGPSWRLDGLALPVISYSGELILRVLAERADQLALEPDFRAPPHGAAQSMERAWKPWCVTDQRAS